MTQNYIRVLELMDDVIATTDKHAAMDALNLFINATYAAPRSAGRRHNSESYSQFRTEILELARAFALTNDRREEELRAVPAIYSDAVFPIVIMTHLLTDYKIALNADDLSTFSEYYRRYSCLFEGFYELRHPIY
jgi:hypothetical protein